MCVYLVCVVSLCIGTCVSKSLRVCLCQFVWVCTRVSPRRYLCVCVDMGVSVWTRTCVCECMCLYVRESRYVRLCPRVRE